MDEISFNHALSLEHLTKTELIEKVKNLQSALAILKSDHASTQALFTKEQLAKFEHFAKISHELRSPLNGILLLCNALTQNNAHNLTPQQKENIIAIDAAGKDLLYIINDMIDQSTREDQELTVDLKTFLVHELISSLKSMYTTQFAQKKISFSVKNNCESSFCITSDQNRIIQLLRNLLFNAYKYTPEEGQVEMRLSHTLENFIIEIADSGLGITIEEQQTIFNPFILGEEGIKNKGASLGLGLSIAKKIATSLKASLTLHSIAGLGSVFTLTLPMNIAKNRGEHPESHTHPIKVQPPLDSVDIPPKQAIYQPLKSRKIMLVEHNLSIIYSFRKVLLTYGAELIHTFDVSEALDRLKNSLTLDLVICSYYEGYTIEQLNALFETTQVPMIALQTARAGDTEHLLSQLERYLKME